MSHHKIVSEHQKLVKQLNELPPAILSKLSQLLAHAGFIEMSEAESGSLKGGITGIPQTGKPGIYPVLVRHKDKTRASKRLAFVKSRHSIGGN